jgi:hypothetical protein
MACRLINTSLGEDNFRLCLHFGVLVPVRDRTAGARTNIVRNRYSQHRCQPAFVPEAMYVSFRANVSAHLFIHALDSFELRVL